MRQALIEAVRADSRAWTLCQLTDCLDRLSQTEALSSPDLIYAKSRLAGLRLEPEQAALWRQALRDRADGEDRAYTQILLARLQLLLPAEDGGAALSADSPDLFRDAESGLPLTAGFPSILRGERDLSGRVLRAGRVTALPS